jgi:predicted DNA-binding transcriptional regulator AlpA
MTKQLIPLTKVAERYGIHRETLNDWFRSPTLGFPQPTKIRNRYYFSQSELDAFDAARKCKPNGEGAHLANGHDTA